MRVVIAAATVGLAHAAIRGTRPTRRMQTQVGRETYRTQDGVRPDEVSAPDADGVRHFLDGALCGLWRSMRAQIPYEEGDTYCVFAPAKNGAFVLPQESAAGWAERASARGLFVAGPLTLAYDCRAKRMLITLKDKSELPENFAIVLAPYAVNLIRKLCNDPENGG